MTTELVRWRRKRSAGGSTIVASQPIGSNIPTAGDFALLPTHARVAEPMTTIVVSREQTRAFSPPAIDPLVHAELRDLRDRVKVLEEMHELVDELDFDEAVRLARELFTASKGRSLYPDEVAEAIGTSVSQAMEICDVLEGEGEIRATD